MAHRLLLKLKTRRFGIDKRVSGSEERETAPHRMYPPGKSFPAKTSPECWGGRGRGRARTVSLIRLSDNVAHLSVAATDVVPVFCEHCDSDSKTVIDQLYCDEVNEAN
ncbi:hypothetical protein J6590_001602 [Homalodisca vitripennis]|nr:hypothetical protein J6590_001602 [Homalodisca vitripennis]